MSLVHDKPPSNLARKSSPLSQARWFATVVYIQWQRAGSLHIA